nr:GGDEF domain-containing protein [Sphingomonas sp. Y57]
MLGTILAYLIASPLTEDAFERDQLFQTILDRRAAILIAPASTVPMALMAANVTADRWPWVWMTIDLLLTGIRWRIMVDAQTSTEDRRRRQAGTLVWLGALWMLALGIATYLCLIAGSPALMIVSAVIGTGVACTITSRNAATPRHALFLLLLLGVPFALGMLRSPIEGMFVPAILAVVWIASLYLFVRQNHASMLRLIKAETAARRAAETDELTGLFNRAHFAERCRQLDEYSGGPADYGFLCVDLDGFKAVNDEHGHLVGDSLLREVASRMREVLRSDDVLFRLGGDEFVALLPRAAPQDCTDVADRLISAIRLPLVFENGLFVQVGASVGSACTCGKKISSAALLQSADAAMYRAKERGKGIHIHS